MLKPKYLDDQGKTRKILAIMPTGCGTIPADTPHGSESTLPQVMIEKRCFIQGSRTDPKITFDFIDPMSTVF